MKKIIITTILICFYTTLSNAQPHVVERTFDISNEDARIQLDLKFGNAITISAWDKNEVSIRAVIEINNGKLNDALILEFEEGSKSLSVSADYDKQLIKQGRREDCPENSYSNYSWNNNRDHYVICSSIVYEITIPRNADLSVESINSDIELISLQGPIKAKSISGFVDLSWPEYQGAELRMKTISGEVFSGLDNLSLNNQKRGAPLVGYELRGTVGKGGGPSVSLESISGNIYVRKGN